MDTTAHKKERPERKFMVGGFISQKSQQLTLSELGKFLTELQKLEFWQRHFGNHNFRFTAGKMDKEQWKRVPFLVKDDFFKIGLNPRLIDLREEIKNKTRHFILRATSGTVSLNEPPLFLMPVGLARSGRKRTLWIEGPFMICLRGVLLNILGNRREPNGVLQTLILDPARLNIKMRQALEEFGADNIFSFPANLIRFTSVFTAAEALSSKIQIIDLSGDFLSATQRRIIHEFFHNARLNLNYTMTEAGKISHSCPELKRRYGRQDVYHPNFLNGTIIELVDMDENGCGEIAVTHLNHRWALLRYRTGDMGRVVKEKCPCGAKFTLFLAGRKNYDYIRYGGALIVRTELERVMGSLKSYVKEWRGEVREKQTGGKLLGELRILIQPADSHILDINHFLTWLAEHISRNLFLTPDKTLADLASAGRFLPLIIEIRGGFPDAAKQILIRKIDDTDD